jgi:hypothetical protein
MRQQGEILYILLEIDAGYKVTPEKHMSYSFDTPEYWHKIYCVEKIS